VEFNGVPQVGHAQRYYAEEQADENFGEQPDNDGKRYKLVRYVPETVAPALTCWLPPGGLIVYPDENAPAWVDVGGKLYFGRWKHDWSAWHLENGAAVRMGNVNRFALIEVPRNGV
jgi:hypothetical protein